MIAASTGGSPTWPRSAARNAVKLLCPPLALLGLLAPGAPNPGSFDTAVIIRRAEPPQTPPDGDSS